LALPQHAVAALNSKANNFQPTESFSDKVHHSFHNSKYITNCLKTETVDLWA
jgi:hypothetical protein